MQPCLETLYPLWSRAICRRSFSIDLDLSFHLRAGAGYDRTCPVSCVLTWVFSFLPQKTVEKYRTKIQNADFLSWAAQKYGFYHTVDYTVRAVYESRISAHNACSSQHRTEVIVDNQSSMSSRPQHLIIALNIITMAVNASKTTHQGPAVRWRRKYPTGTNVYSVV